jgi:hypothetical protein
MRYFWSKFAQFSGLGLAVLFLGSTANSVSASSGGQFLQVSSLVTATVTVFAFAAAIALVTKPE